MKRCYETGGFPAVREERSIIVYAVEEHMYLDSIHGQRERVQVFYREVRVSAANDEGPTFLNLLAHPCLVLGVLRQLPQHPRKSVGSRFMAGKREALHLCSHLRVRELGLRVLRRVGFNWGNIGCQPTAPQ